MGKAQKINIFTYNDYRVFLQDWYQFQKTNQAGFSHRAFLGRCGFKSSNLLVFVIEGKRNLSEKSIEKFIKGLKLTKRKAEYFKTLVHFNQETDSQTKERYFRHLIRLKKLNNIKLVNEDEYEYFSSWYHPIIRELIEHPSFEGNPDWLAKVLDPAITRDEAQKSLALLEKMELIKKDKKEDSYKKTKRFLKTADEVISHTIKNYHKNLLKISQTKIDEVKSTKRDISSLTLAINSKNLPVLKKAIYKFYDDIFKLLSNQEDFDEVYWLNIQLFPATQVYKKIKK